MMERNLERKKEALAQDILRDAGMETGESLEPASVLLALYLPVLRAHVLGQPRPPEVPRPHLTRKLGDTVLVNQVATCEADLETCQRTAVSYVDRTRSTHHDGLAPELGSLLAGLGIEIQAIPCNHHGGMPITAIDEV